MTMKSAKEADLPAVLNIEHDTLYASDEFKNTLKQISEAVNHAQNLVSVQTVSKLDPESLETTINDLGQAQSLARNVNKVRRDLKRYLKGRSDKIVDQFDQYLNEAQFDKLSYFDAKAKTLKKELSQYRINQHWEEIKPVFDANLDNYPIIGQLAPALTNFDTFRIRHPKLVTGAKSWRLGDKQMSAVNDDLYAINNCLTDLKNNPMHLGDSYRTAVLSGFIENPTKDNYLELKDKMIEQMQKDVENERLAKQKAEEERQAAAKAEAEKKKAQQMQQMAQNAQNETDRLRYQQAASSAYQNVERYQNQQIQAQKLQQEAINRQARERNESRKWLADYVYANAARYTNIAQDVRQKAKLVYDLIHDLDNTGSQFYSYVHQESDSTKQAERIMSVIKEIAIV